MPDADNYRLSIGSRNARGDDVTDAEITQMLAEAQVSALTNYADAIEIAMNRAEPDGGMRPGLLVAIELARQGAAAIAEKYDVVSVGLVR